MLYLKFALNIENLAEEMIDEISRAWKNPFEAPVVLFPDPKLEQWFRLKWIQRKASLAGFNSMMIDRFLMEILIGDDLHKKKLNADMLRNVILAYLVKETDGVPNYMKMDEEVQRYLVIDGNLDETHLFDFAGKMASLFLEYETSRPHGFIRSANGSPTPGILDKWKQGHLDTFFAKSNNEISNREIWQRDLYSAIFHAHDGKQSLLSEVFENEAKRKNGERTEYMTIPYLYFACHDKEGNVHFHTERIGNTPLFIFGLGGMGQFYRVILQKYAETHDVHAYIQNPCMEFWEDTSTIHAKNAPIHRKWISRNSAWSDASGDLENIRQKMSVNIKNDNAENDIDDIAEYTAEEALAENTLLCNWGRSGRDNIKLWCQAVNYDFDFRTSNNISDASELPHDTLLHKVQYAIANRSNILPDYTASDCKQQDSSLDITATPTKIREIEALHTSICKLMQNGVRVSDILVVSPNLDGYRTAIKTIFDQSPEKKKYAGDNAKEGFLHIPFAIVDSPARSSQTENALENLFAILEQGTITRPDFFSLIRNPVVQQTRHISEDDVSKWESWIEGTNVYRDRKHKKEDWLDGVRRLLLAKMTKNPLQISDNIIMPYSDMATSDTHSLCKFVECIDSLEKWMEFGNGYRVADIDKLNDFINEWISMSNPLEDFASESIIINNVTQAIEGLRNQMDAGLTSISWKVIKQTLLTAAQSSAYSCGSLFINGITFMNFIPNRIIPVKHLFFIGGDSMNFPGAKQHNTLDLRKFCTPWPGDDSPIAKRRYAFLCQLMSTSESFHISYVNQDIRKDAELYPTSVVNDIRRFLVNSIQSNCGNEAISQAEVWPERKVSLDETRDFDELYTQKSLRSKRAFLNMMQDGFAHVSPQNVAPKNVSINTTTKCPERVPLYTLSNFLKDPFMFRVSQMLAESDTDDPEKELFEPIHFDALQKSSLLKMMVAAELSHEDEELEKFKRESLYKGNMPDGIFGKKFLAEVESSKNAILAQMGESFISQIKDSWSYKSKIQDMQFSRNNSEKWTLSGTLDWCDSDNLEKITHMVAVSSSTKAPSREKFLSPYVKSLAVIAARANGASANKTQTIQISIYNGDISSEVTTATVSMTPVKAQELLQDIYTAAFGDETNRPFSKAVPASLLDSTQIKDIRSFKDQLLKGPWEYFDKKSLFDPITDVGFDANDFANQWKEASEKMKSLMQMTMSEQTKAKTSETIKAAKKRKA
ncbi:MAG: exodeoxyribonuclease V subunit gamma [Fibrobacter sp.]|nr:exodeoxyribonuclease V subunit gamma [Fibrobacter sp.]